MNDKGKAEFVQHLLEEAADKVRKANGFFNQMVKKDCDFMYQTECMGFEGVNFELCSNAHHDRYNTMYPMCKIEDCPRCKTGSGQTSLKGKENEEQSSNCL